MNTLLITVDALRADHLGQYGYERDTMPALDRISDEGTIFHSAYSNAPYTRISVPSFHTSQYLAYEQIAELPTIASILSEAGVKTATIGTQTGIDLVNGDFGFDENIDLGRDEYQSEANEERDELEKITFAVNRVAWKLGRSLFDPSGTVYNRGKQLWDSLPFVGESFQYLGYTDAETVTDHAIEWLESNRADDCFLWIHYMEGHRPYGVHETDPEYAEQQPDLSEITSLMKKAGLSPEAISEEERQQLIDLYDSDLRYCSSQMERLFDSLVSLDMWNESNILFSSDHGEEFGEHGLYFHRNLPYDELINVPLLVKACQEQSCEINEQRELLDIAPTICSLHDVETDRFDFQGEYLFEGDDRRVVSIGSADPTKRRIIGIRSDGWKYIASDDGTWLYDLSADPAEQISVADTNRSRVEEFEQWIPEYLVERDAERLSEPSDEVNKEQLEALGYMELKDQ